MAARPRDWWTVIVEIRDSDVRAETNRLLATTRYRGLHASSVPASVDKLYHETRQRACEMAEIGPTDPYRAVVTVMRNGEHHMVTTAGRSV